MDTSEFCIVHFAAMALHFVYMNSSGFVRVYVYTLLVQARVVVELIAVTCSLNINNNKLQVTSYELQQNLEKAMTNEGGLKERHEWDIQPYAWVYHAKYRTCTCYTSNNIQYILATHISVHAYACKCMRHRLCTKAISSNTQYPELYCQSIITMPCLFPSE